MDYQTFVDAKLATKQFDGIDYDGQHDPALFPHQLALTRWALKKGRAAIFADTGLGTPRM